MIKITTGIMIGAVTILGTAQLSGIPAKLGDYDRMKLEYLELKAFKEETIKKPGVRCALSGSAHCPCPAIRPYYTDKQADKQLKSTL